MRVQVRPITSAMMTLARREAGVLLLSGDQDAPTYATDELIHALARRGIVAWEGIGDLAGKPMDPSPRLVDALLNSSREAYDCIDQQYWGPYAGIEYEKNASSPSRNGISRRAGKATVTPVVRSPAKSVRTPSTPSGRKTAKGSGK